MNYGDKYPIYRFVTIAREAVNGISVSVIHVGRRMEKDFYWIDMY